MHNRTTPENITKLEPNEIFVFGSNFAGFHGKGAAKQALKFGAIYGQCEGLMGKSYGIPTKNFKINTLPIHKIEPFVIRFIAFAKRYSYFRFYVTAIGCGLAGYSPKDIAPLFKDCIELENVYLPKSFWKELGDMV